MGFADDFLDKYRDLFPRIGAGHSEIDERVAWADIVLQDILGYRHSLGHYQIEQLRVRRDIPVKNKAGDPVIVVETKRSVVGLTPADENQAFGYTIPTTKYVILTDSIHLKLFRNASGRPVLADLNMQTLIATEKIGNQYSLSLQDRTEIERFLQLTFEELWEPKYDDFDTAFALRRSIADNAVFDAMILDLDKCVTYLNHYALQAFDFFRAQVDRLDEDEERITQEITALETTNAVAAARLRIERRQRRTVAQHFRNFSSDYKLWLQLSDPDNSTRRTQEQNKVIFCKESLYVLLNKLLFIRICEDKELLVRKVSNGGISIWKDFTTYLKDSYRDLLTLAFSDATKLYSHLFAEGVFDWYLSGDEGLDATLNKVLWRLNLYDFSAVDRDILGKLYEKYFPREVRKTLGEFYTHEIVVDFILNAVGYTADHDLRGVSVLDPACGSGTFLVRSLGRLLSSLGQRNLPNRERLYQSTSNLVGFDINPFACAIAEMNMVFQLVDDYVLSGERAGDLPRVAVYQTDSLEPSGSVGLASSAAVQLSFADILSPGGSMLIADRNAVDDLKAKTYDVIVGNPPYVRTTNRDYKKWYAPIAVGTKNTYRYFLHAYLAKLKPGGHLGFIVPNTWLADKDSRLLRKWMLDNYRIEQVIYLPYFVKAFYEVDQSTTILILRPKQAEDGEAYTLTIGEARSLEELREGTFRRVETSLDIALKNDTAYGLDNVLTIQTIPGVYEALQRMRDNAMCTLVPDLVSSIYNGELRRTERSRLHDEPGTNRAVSLRGQNIYPFFIDITATRRKPQWYDISVPIKNDSHAQEPRLVIMSRARQTQKKRIKAGLVDPSTAPHDRVYCDSRGMNYILARESAVPIEYIEGMLNSAPANFYVKAYSASNQVNSSDLARLPIPKVSDTNSQLVAEMVDAVQQIRALSVESDAATQRLANPFVGSSDLVPLYQSRLISSFPGDSPIGDTVHQQGNTVALTSGTLTCQDEPTARLLSIILNDASPTALLSGIHFPSIVDEVVSALASYDQAETSHATDAANRLALEKKAEDLAYEIYGLSDQREIVEEALRTANRDQPSDEEEDMLDDEEGEE